MYRYLSPRLIQPCHFSIRQVHAWASSLRLRPSFSEAGVLLTQRPQIHSPEHRFQPKQTSVLRDCRRRSAGQVLGFAEQRRAGPRASRPLALGLLREIQPIPRPTRPLRYVDKFYSLTTDKCLHWSVKYSIVRAFHCETLLPLNPQVGPTPSSIFGAARRCPQLLCSRMGTTSTKATQGTAECAPSSTMRSQCTRSRGLRATLGCSLLSTIPGRFRSITSPAPRNTKFFSSGAHIAMYDLLPLCGFFEDFISLIQFQFKNNRALDR